jgi:hypothetical protein
MLIAEFLGAEVEGYLGWVEANWANRQECDGNDMIF